MKDILVHFKVPETIPVYYLCSNFTGSHSVIYAYVMSTRQW